ncbi:MAG: hypothetical protein ACOCRK_00740 [bacterium]
MILTVLPAILVTLVLLPISTVPIASSLGFSRLILAAVDLTTKSPGTSTSNEVGVCFTIDSLSGFIALCLIDCGF